MKNRLTKRSLPLIIIFLAFMLSCDFESEGELHNIGQDTIFFSTNKEIDGFYKNAISLGFSNDLYNYKLNPESFDRLFYNFNSEVESSDIYFDTLIVITKFDTISLYGKTEIFSKFKRKSKYKYIYDVK